MTPEKQRIAITEVCGWKCAGHPDQVKATEGWEFGYQFVIQPSGELVTHNSIPDYLNDLNAMHEAEKVLSPHLRNEFISHLWAITGNDQSVNFWTEYNFRAFYACIHATATQRAEAFLRTLSKWEEA